MKSLLAGTKEKDQTNVIPKKAKLRSVSVKDGIATADFSKRTAAEFQRRLNGGGDVFVGSIVNTLTEFPEVQKVRHPDWTVRRWRHSQVIWISPSRLRA